MQISPPAHPTPRIQRATVDDRDSKLRAAAVEFEASFLAEMLKSAGLGKTQGPFSGGTGEEQFSGFLVQAQAREMAHAGGIGLADAIYRSLKGRPHEAG